MFLPRRSKLCVLGYGTSLNYFLAAVGSNQVGALSDYMLVLRQPIGDTSCHVVAFYMHTSFDQDHPHFAWATEATDAAEVETRIRQLQSMPLVGN